MVTIVNSVSLSQMPKPSAIAILMASYGMNEQEAGKIINPITITNGNDSGQIDEGANQEAQGENQGEENNSNS